MEKSTTAVQDFSTGDTSEMMARDGPENASLSGFGKSAILGQTADFSHVKTASKKAPASRLISTAKASSVASRKKTSAPKGKSRKKPFAPSGMFWRAHGPGFDLKRRVVASHNGVERRRELYVAHLGKAELADMKKKHKGKSLERAIEDWIKSHGG